MKKLVMVAMISFYFLYGICLAAGDGIMPDAGERRYQDDKKEFAMLKAVEDIDKNMDFLLRMHQEVDASTGLGWEIFIADKLPSQTVAVIRLMTRGKVGVNRMCPRVVIEDMMSDSDYDQWMTRTISSLEAIRMADSKEETVRQECLALIRESLAKSPSRKTQ